jgi:hypothetical protein
VKSRRQVVGTQPGAKGQILSPMVVSSQPFTDFLPTLVSQKALFMSLPILVSPQAFCEFLNFFQIIYNQSTFFLLSQAEKHEKSHLIDFIKQNHN